MTSPPLAPYRQRARNLSSTRKTTRVPQRIAEAFAADAVLTISLATSTIAFPARTVGSRCDCENARHRFRRAIHAVPDLLRVRFARRAMPA